MSGQMFDPPESHPTPGPSSTRRSGDTSLFVQLIRLVTSRAERVGLAGPTDPTAMEDLREAVGALDHYLDAAEVVRKATPANVPAAWASPEKRAVSVEREPAPAPRDVTGQQPAFPPFRDQTTGLHTRAGFEAIAGGALKRCARHAHPFALLMVRLSATPVSDLRTAGMITQSGLRASDCVAAEHPRTLLIGLPETSTEAARSVGERLVAALQTGEFRDMDLRLGLANRSVDGETLESLIGAAHSRLTPAAGAAP